VTTDQLSLPAPVTVPSPLCHREHCRRGGRAVLGEPVDLGGCVNRSVRCLTCQITGVLSTTARQEA